MQGHLDSMQGNNHQMAGVDDALLRTGSRLEEVVYSPIDVGTLVRQVSQVR